jgi:hypothetical protein
MILSQPKEDCVINDSKPNIVITLWYDFVHIYNNITYSLSFSIILDINTDRQPIPDFNINTLAFVKSVARSCLCCGSHRPVLISKHSLELDDVVSSIKNREFYAMPVDNDASSGYLKELELRKQKLINRGWTYIESPK